MSDLNSTENKYLVLSVDDNEINRYTMKRILVRCGYEVIEACDGKEALEQLNKNPDLVILDVNLPDMSGFEICRRIKVVSSSTPVLQVSASFVETKDKVEGLESGADGYLAQPIDPSVLVATIRSLFRLRKAEREKEVLIGELKQERESRERFVATLTHDLRSPLSAARMNTQLLQRQSALGDREKELAKRIVRNLDRVDLMIQDLLDVSLLKAGGKLLFSMEDCDLNDLIDQLLEDFESKYGNRFIKVAAPDFPKGLWNANALKRVLENLVTNAVKYGDPERSVDIVLEKTSETQISISVRNRGNVISLSDQSQIFDQFQRSDSAKAGVQKGWGLGLALVRGVAAAHGGLASVSSNETDGTIFSLLMPIDCRDYGIQIPEA